MNPKRPPKKKGDCPKGGDHVWQFHSKDGGNVTHKCSRCGITFTRPLDPNRQRDHVFSKLIIDQESGCMLWTGYVARNGYGNTGGQLVHRLMYEWFTGPIPAGLEIDHLCRNRLCASP